MKAINSFKKGMAFALSAAMVLGLTPAISGDATKVQAAENTSKIILYDVDLSGGESKGDIVDIDGERFYVTKIGDADITCFAVKGLSIKDNRQSDNPDLVRFSESAYSSYNNSEVKQYTDKYGVMLNEEYGLEATVGLEGYGDIGYVAPYAYSASIYAEKTWYQNGNYWTSSTYRNYGAWKVSGNSLNAVPGDSNTAMVRPAVTFAKSKIDEIVKEVTSVTITDLDAPMGGRALDTDAISVTEGVEKIEVAWTSNHEVSEDEKLSAKYNTLYTAEITVRAGNGYIFTSTTDVLINAETYSGEIKDNGKTLVVTSKTFRTEKDKLISITDPQSIRVANGTAYASMNLPTEVNIVTEGGTATSASVSWDTITPASGSYNPDVLTEQTVILNGTVTCPDTIDANGVALTTTINITIEAASITGAPTANPAAGTYTENQSVTLTSSTEGAKIYYTTDGSTPTLTGGVPGETTKEYTAPISVTGTEGQSITTVIKAMAVKSGMQDSSVETFTYTIQLPVSKYTITATAGANGTISPGGAVKVTAGSSQTFTISPSSGYVIDTLKVDGLEVTAATNYTFSDVSTNHTIEVTFKQESQTPEVTAPSITTQPGNATVKAGETATFTIAARGTDLTYQWQIDRNDGNGWVNIAGATATGYTTSTVDISCNGYKYQCVVSNSAGTVTSNTAVLTVTENTTPDPNPEPIDYNILDGANSSWTQNSDGSLSIRGSGELSKFVGVKVDGTLVDGKNYTVKEGSTIITLKTDYLNTISVGTHTFEILWTDGSASTTFTIKADTSDDGNQKDDVPKTGDDTPIAWMFILSILSGTGLIITAKKRRVNPDSSKR